MADKMVSVSGAVLLSEGVRKYNFKLVEALVGVRIVHEYGSLIIANSAMIGEAFSAFRADPDADTDADTDTDTVSGFMSKVAKIRPLIETAIRILTFSRIVDLAKEFLSGAEIDGEATDKNGMIPAFGRDPLELYSALFWALTVNYPKYFGPLLEALTSDDSTPDTEKNSE